MKYIERVFKATFIILTSSIFTEGCTEETKKSTPGGILESGLPPQLIVSVRSEPLPQHIVIKVDGLTNYKPLLLGETPVASCGFDRKLTKHEVSILDHRGLKDLVLKKPSDTQGTGGYERPDYEPSIVEQNAQSAKLLPVVNSFSFEGNCDDLTLSLTYKIGENGSLSVNYEVSPRILP